MVRLGLRRDDFFFLPSLLCLRMCCTVRVKELMLSESAGWFSSMHTSSSKLHIGRLARKIVAKSMKRQSRIGLGGHGGILACQNSSWRLLSCSN